MESMRNTKNWRHLIFNYKYSENFILPLNRSNNNKLIQMMSFCKCLLAHFSVVPFQMLNQRSKQFYHSYYYYDTPTSEKQSIKIAGKNRQKKFLEISYSSILKNVHGINFLSRVKRCSRLLCCAVNDESMRMFCKSEWRRMFQIFLRHLCVLSRVFFIVYDTISDNFWNRVEYGVVKEL